MAQLSYPSLLDNEVERADNLLHRDYMGEVSIEGLERSSDLPYRCGLNGARRSHPHIPARAVEGIP